MVNLLLTHAPNDDYLQFDTSIYMALSSGILCVFTVNFTTWNILSVNLFYSSDWGILFEWKIRMNFRKNQASSGKMIQWNIVRRVYFGKLG